MGDMGLIYKFKGYIRVREGPCRAHTRVILGLYSGYLKKRKGYIEILQGFCRDVQDIPDDGHVKWTRKGKTVWNLGL